MSPGWCMRLFLVLPLVLTACPVTDKPAGDDDTGPAAGPVDADEDGHDADSDCDDADAAVHPGAAEVCDGLDNDCSGAADEDPVDGTAWYADADADGYGAGVAVAVACEAPSGAAAADGDCDDADPALSPGATEVCDGAVDEDCDGLVDDADPSVSAATTSTWWLDADRDGYGGATAVQACSVPDGYVATPGDCDDASTASRPGRIEICDAADADEDCNGLADDADADPYGATEWYADADGDGYGAEGSVVERCDAPAGYVATGGDCDDTAATSNPAGVEVCDAADADEDCDGLADDADTSVDPDTKVALHVDADRDGYGDPAVELWWCDASIAWVADGTDCDDARATVSPSVALEDCSTTYDDDCDGSANALNATACFDWYEDADGDGYGDGTPACLCSASGTYTTDEDGDCDESDAAIHPAMPEVCDYVDQDCDGEADEGLTRYYTDDDADGYGVDTETGSCTSFAGAATLPGDCDDADTGINPGLPEVCDDADVDEDCDGLADDADAGVSDQPEWYVDADADGYGDETTAGTVTCEGPEGWAPDGTDCDDSDDEVNPGNHEWYGDTRDEDCDGVTEVSRTYCSPNVGPGRTYTTVLAAVFGHETEICVASGSYSYPSTLDIPISGQGMGVSTFVGDVGEEATDLTVDGDATAARLTHTLTRVELTGSVNASLSAGWTVYDSIVGAVDATVTSGASTVTGGIWLYNTWITGAAADYAIDVYARGDAGYGYTSTANVHCYGCTVDAGAVGIYAVNGTYYGRAYLYLYNTVYENAATDVSGYTGLGGYGYVYTYESNTDTSLLDYSYEPPRPTGSLIDAGSSSYGLTTDFWGVTRSGDPDLGAVEY